MELILGDCLQKMKRMDSDISDITITSPPYNMNLRIRNGVHCSRQIVKEISTKYVNFSDNLTMENYYEFNKNVINECLRLSPLVFYNIQFLTGNKIALFEIIGHFSKLLKEVIIWDKVNAQPAIGESILNSQYEVVLIFDRNNAISRKFDNGNFKRGSLSNHWSIKRGKKVDKSHGAVFPLELARIIITNFSKQGDTVLDPFMGTGTTGVACLQTKRNFIGIELDKHYYELAQKRIKEETSQLSLF